MAEDSNLNTTVQTLNAQIDALRQEMRDAASHAEEAGRNAVEFAEDRVYFRQLQDRFLHLSNSLSDQITELRKKENMIIERQNRCTPLMPKLPLILLAFCVV